jgi:hypothetical protein
MESGFYKRRIEELKNREKQPKGSVNRVDGLNSLIGHVPPVIPFP